VSVINKMLRDLDSRQAAGTIPLSAHDSRTGMASGTLITNDSDGAGRRRVSLRFGVALVAAVMLMGGTAGAWWYLNQNQFLQRKVDQVPVAWTPAMGTPVIVAAPVAPVAAPSAPQKTVEPVMVASPALATVVPVKVTPQEVMVTSPLAAKLPVPQSGATQAETSLKMDNTFKVGASHVTPSRSPAAAPISAVATAVPQSLPQRRSPALEALAQAQSLWNAGSHEAGIDLLHEALVAAERANLAGTPSGNNSVLASLARELARMELAEGRASQALEMLTRLEPALSGVAEVWAMRGNAAQRLGHHQESAAAYLMALKLRPDEPRWMLGAAVSLAAQGQTAAAAELAEKARAGGVLSPEVATYLRQLGVPLRER
jgi:MSHA biogenesis protein MshN